MVEVVRREITRATRDRRECEAAARPDPGLGWGDWPVRWDQADPDEIDLVLPEASPARG